MQHIWLIGSASIFKRLHSWRCNTSSFPQPISTITAFSRHKPKLTFASATQFKAIRIGCIIVQSSLPVTISIWPDQSYGQHRRSPVHSKSTQAIHSLGGCGSFINEVVYLNVDLCLCSVVHSIQISENGLEWHGTISRSVGGLLAQFAVGKLERFTRELHGFRTPRCSILMAKAVNRWRRIQLPFCFVRHQTLLRESVGIRWKRQSRLS